MSASLMTLFLGGPLDGEVWPTIERQVQAEWPAELDVSDPLHPTVPRREPATYTIGRFGRSPGQWIWIGVLPGMTEEEGTAAVWRHLARPGVRRQLAGEGDR